MTTARRLVLGVMVTALLGAPSAVRAAVAGRNHDAVAPLAAGNAADALAIGELAGMVLIAGVSGAVAVVLIGLGVLIGMRPRRRHRAEHGSTVATGARPEDILHRRLLRRARVRMEADPIVEALLDDANAEAPEPIQPEPEPTQRAPRRSRRPGTEHGS
jgi:uncharacterized membrane protein